MLAYGETDAVVPFHQGHLLARLSQGHLPCTVVRGAGHGMFLSHAATLTPLARDFDAESRGEAAEAAAARRARFGEVARIVEAIPATRYRTSFSRAHTRGTIRRLYRDLLAATGAGGPAAGPPPARGVEYR